MNIKINGKDLILENLQDFNLKQTLECGQCFRFEKISEDNYLLVAFEKELNIQQNKNEIIFYNTNKKDFENIWKKYFDLDRDYKKIKIHLSKKDNILKEAINFADGIRILNQEPWECLISFIISQNNRISMIKQVVKNISEKYGEKINTEYTFPTAEILLKTTEEELKKCKVGFRGKYILDATEKIFNKEVDIYNTEKYSTNELRNNLMKIKGVGPKVSDCVMLFSLNRPDAFPTDVWVKRVMEHFYFNGENTDIKKITSFANNYFKEYSGFAQQYLFYYARENKIGIK